MINFRSWVNCILSNINLGMGGGNNLGIKHVDTDLALILNPDVILEKDAISNLLESANELSSFAIISPISDNKKYPNYKIDKNQIIGNLNPFKVFSVDGYAMTLNLKKLNSIKNFYYFDENIFMYLENDDLCKRIRDLNEDIYINPRSKVNHLGGKAVDSIYEYQIEMSRNWHWIWSKFYFNKKHYGLLSSLKDGIPTFLSALVKNDQVLIIDDLIATGGTAEAAAKLVEISQAKVSGFIFVINLFDLGGTDNLLQKKYKVENLIDFPGH